MPHEKRKQFYLIRRKDKLTKGKPTFYCRFRSVDGELLPWQSTGETVRTRGENWAIAKLEEQKVEASPALTLETFAAGFFRWGSPWIKRQDKMGRAFGKAQAKNRQNHLDRYILPRFGQTVLARISKPSIEDWLSGLPLVEVWFTQEKGEPACLMGKAPGSENLTKKHHTQQDDVEAGYYNLETSFCRTRIRPTDKETDGDRQHEAKEPQDR